MSFSVEYIYQIMDRYSGPLSKITSKTNRFQAASERAAKASKNMGAKMKSAGEKMASVQNIVGGAAITAGLAAFAKSASTVKDKMADVSRVTGISGKALGILEGDLEKVSYQTGKVSTGLADIVFQGGKFGIPTENMAKYVLIVSKTANAFDMIESEAGKSLGKIKDMLKLNIDETKDFMSQVNMLADSTTADGRDMIQIIQRTSGTFRNLNVPKEVVAGWAAFANQITVSPELAASGINMMFSRMKAKIPGMTKKMLDDPRKAVMDYLRSLEKMDVVKRGGLIRKVFGEEAARFVNLTIPNLDNLKAAIDTAANPEALKSMDKEWQNYLTRTSTKWKRLKAIFMGFSNMVGTHILKAFDKVSPKLEAFGLTVLKFTESHPMLTKIVIAMLAVTAAAAAIIVPLGILVMFVSYLLPLFGLLAGAITAVSAPMLIVAGLVVYVGSLFAGMYAKSDKFRQSISNLVAAFAPLVTALKTIAVWVGSKLGIEFDKAGKGLKKWGDIFSNVINGIAAMIKGLFNLIEGLAKATSALSMGEGVGKAWAVLKESLGYDVAVDKAGKGMNNKVELTGQIGVTGTGVAKVESAEIGLNTGGNMAMAY